MIKVTTKNGATTITANGNVHELVADAMCIVRSLYFGLKEDKHDKAAEKFKRNLLEIMPTAFEDEDDIHRFADDRIKSITEVLNNISSLLSGVLDDSEDEDEDKEDEE